MNPEDTQPTLEFFWQHVHPEDREGLQQVVDESVREKCDFEHEFRLVGLDGVVRSGGKQGRAEESASQQS